MDNKNAVLKALHELGFRFKKNEFDAYEFNYESYTYVCNFDDDDDTFVSFNIPFIYTLEDEQYRPIILDIINEIHCGMKISKLMLVRDNVWVSYEFRLVDGMDLEQACRYAIMNLLVVTEKFAAKVNGGGIPKIGD